MDAYPTLRADDSEPTFTDLAASREHRKRRLALAYRVFGAMGWGLLGDGHITARDPERDDHFWLIKWGVPFNQATIDDLVLVGPGGKVVEGHGDINMTAYHIHAPIHEARPDAVAAAHTHTQYGTPWVANVKLFDMICQEATAFHRDQALFDDEEVQVMSVDGGKRIAAALGSHKLVILRNHGLLTVGQSIDECVGWFLQAERVAEVHVKAPNAEAISDEGAARAATEIADPLLAWHAYQFALRSKVPDPTVVG